MSLRTFSEGDRVVTFWHGCVAILEARVFADGELRWSEVESESFTTMYASANRAAELANRLNLPVLAKALPGGLVLTEARVLENVLSGAKVDQ